MKKCAFKGRAYPQASMERHMGIKFFFLFFLGGGAGSGVRCALVCKT